MEKPFYAKLFKIFLWVLLVASIGLLVGLYLHDVGIKHFDSLQDGSVNKLLFWTYGFLILAVLIIVGVGLVIKAIHDPKSLIRILIGLVVAAVVCGVAFLLARHGKQPVGYLGGEVPTSTLRLTDTVLNLTYILGGAAILSIIVGEIVMLIRRGKKA